jgi:large conductance mechanosensitive channel
MWKEFKQFIARGNVVDLAVGVIIGAAFGKIVSDLVDGVIMPPIGLILKHVDFQSLFVVLDSSKGYPASLAEAKTKGIPVIAYGQLFNDILSFVIIGLVVFLMIRQVNKIKNAVEHPEPGAPTTKECPFCASTISVKAKRCPQCTSQLAG